MLDRSGDYEPPDPFEKDLRAVAGRDVSRGVLAVSVEAGIIRRD